MKKNSLIAATGGVLGVIFLTSLVAAAPIASVDFDGRTVSSNTASNLNWTVDGVADPGDLTASHDLFDTGDAQDRFAVDRNLHNEGNWSVDVPLSVGGASIDLSTLDLDVFIYNNAGDLQTTQRNVDMLAELFNSSNVLLDSDAVLGIYANSGTAVQPQAISFDFSGNTLTAGDDFTLRLTASGQGSGNNSGIDNFTLNGQVNQVVPEPTSVGIWLLLAGLLTGLGIIRRYSFAK